MPVPVRVWSPTPTIEMKVLLNTVSSFDVTVPPTWICVPLIFRTRVIRSVLFTFSA